MEAVPDKFDLDSIREEISKVEGVKDVHELHLWAVSTDHYSLTGHVFIHEDVQPFEVIQEINHILKEKYGIQHSTIQTEHPAIHDHGDYGKQFLTTKS
jgi:cobalt-zinc-cadmium efflux system protein